MKKRRRYAAKRRLPSRRWHIPPPLIHGPETLEGGGILQEWGNELGVVLWQASRDVMLWATTEPDARANTFSTEGTFRRRQMAAVVEAETDSRIQAGLRVI